MKPAQIRVFDGLRITTDHVNHLQGAFASGFEDFRQILGLGQVQSGLQVTVQDDGSTTIHPGLAFDYQKNRLACDDPLNLTVTFGPDDKVKYVCLKYEQVDDGAVEGHATMIWDSCSALVRDAMPDRKENLVTLAKIIKKSDGKLCVRQTDEPDECENAGAVSETLVAVGPAAPLAGPSDSTSPSTDSAPAPVEPEDASPPQTAGSDLPPLPDSSVLEVPGHAPAAPNVAPMQCRQGVLALASDPSAVSYFHLVLAPALRKKFGPDSISLALTLAQAEIAPGISVCGLNAHTKYTADLTLSSLSPEGLPRTFHLEGVANGGASPATGGVTQFATSTIQTHPVPPLPGTLWCTADFTARGLAEFPFTGWSAAPESARPALPPDVLSALSVLLQLVPAPSGFQLTMKLLWDGKISDQSLQALETQSIGFAWQILFGWQALGF
jgi:hypothetical protein